MLAGCTRPTKPTHRHHLASHRVARQPAGAPCGLEVVAADESVEIEHLADEVETGLEPALEVLGADFIERDSAARDFRLAESERPRDRDDQALHRRDEATPLLPREFGTDPIRRDRRARQDRLRQAT